MLENAPTSAVKSLIELYQKKITIEDLVDFTNDHASELSVLTAMALTEYKLAGLWRPAAAGLLKKPNINQQDIHALFIGTSPYELTKNYPIDKIQLRTLKFDDTAKEVIKNSIKRLSDHNDVIKTIREINDTISLNNLPPTLFSKGIDLARRLFDLGETRAASYFAAKATLISESLSKDLGFENLRNLLNEMYLTKTPKTSEKNDVDFEKIGGYSEIKDYIRNDLVNVLTAKMKRPELLEFGAELPRGVLLHGPPGTGKSMFLDGIVNELKKTMGDDKIHDFKYRLEQSKWLGESTTLLQQTFEKYRQIARKTKEGLILIVLDEAESTFEKRGEDIHETTKRQVGQLLSYMNGSDELPKNVIFLAATNLLGDIDPAFLRPGRFDYKREIGYPNKNDMRQIYEKILAKKNAIVQPSDLDEMAAQSFEKIPHCTGADIRSVISMAASKKLNEFMRNSDWETAPTESISLDKPALLNSIVEVGTRKKQQAEAAARKFDHDTFKKGAAIAPEGMYS